MSIYTIAQHNMKLEIPYNNKLLKMRKKEKDFKRLQKTSKEPRKGPLFPSYKFVA